MDFMLLILVFTGAFLWLLFFSLLRKKTVKNNKTKPNKNNQPKQELQYSKVAILTNNEIEFFQKLKSALPELAEQIYPQVSFSAFLRPTISKYHYSSWIRHFRTISQKRCDFLIVDKEFNPILIIECDDSSHNGREKEDNERDKLALSAEIKTLRLWNSETLQPDNIRLVVGEFLPLVLQSSSMESSE